MFQTWTCSYILILNSVMDSFEMIPKDCYPCYPLKKTFQDQNTHITCQLIKNSGSVIGKSFKDLSYLYCRKEIQQSEFEFFSGILFEYFSPWFLVSMHSHFIQRIIYMNLFVEIRKRLIRKMWLFIMVASCSYSYYRIDWKDFVKIMKNKLKTCFWRALKTLSLSADNSQSQLVQ